MVVNNKLYQHFWDSDVEISNEYSSVLFDGSVEYELTRTLRKNTLQGMYDNLSSVEWITGGFDLGDIAVYTLPSNFSVYYWPTFFFTHTLAILETHKWWPDIEETIKKTPAVTNTFITYNRKPHDYRCLLVDNLAKSNLIEDNLVSWQVLNPIYNFRYFNQKILSIDQEQQTVEESVDSHIIAPQHKNAFMQVISESNILAPIFITEKTVKALAMGDIFLTLGPSGFHSKLEELGFELYTEIFNYDFDNKSLQERVNGIIKNIINLPRETKELESIKERLVEKRIYNYHRSLQLARNSEHMNLETLNLLKKNYSIFPEGRSTRIALDYLDVWNNDIFSKSV